MSIYWKLRRFFISIRRSIRFHIDSSRRRDRRLMGMPVYFEDTGEKVGEVRRVIRNSVGEIVGYEIRDENERIIYFPADAFEEHRRGLIFAPLWYSEGLKMVAELEAKAKMPDIHDFIIHGRDREELYDIISSRHPEISRYVEEVLLLRESLMERVNDLETRLTKLRREMVELSGRRLMKEIGRREFAERIMEARREMNITEVSIRRCRELLLRIDKIPFLPRHIHREELLSIRKILSNIPVSMVVLDEDAVVRGMNEHVENNFGYRLAEMKGKRFTDFVVARDRDAILEANDRIFEGSEAEEVEFEFIDAYGVHHLLYGRLTGMSDRGRRICIMAFQSREEEKSLKKIFSERVAHLFLNPLSIAQGYLHLLNEERYGGLTEEQKKQIRAIEKSLGRIEKLVKDTIKLSK